MKYEVITDFGDLLVLTIHGRVLMVSRDMSEITAKMNEDYIIHMNRVKKTIEKALLSTNNLTVEEVAPSKRTNPTNKVISSDTQAASGSLGKLFDL